ncbi:MAG: hypothetical protein EBR15_08025 [Gammaproteobacteria bacterium]|nr:hypothetical protein [Gammaproteobacteria bacterium]
MLPLDKPPEHVCLLRLSAIGDTCNVVPVLRTLQRAWPTTRFTWIIGRIEARLMDEDGWTTEGSRMVILRDDPVAQAEELGRRLGENILERHRARDGRPGRIDGT